MSLMIWMKVNHMPEWWLMNKNKSLQCQLRQHSPQCRYQSHVTKMLSLNQQCPTPSTLFLNPAPLTAQQPPHYLAHPCPPNFRFAVLSHFTKVSYTVRS